MKPPADLRPLALEANLTLDTPAGQVLIRDLDATTLEVFFPTPATFRHVLLGIRPKLGWVSKQKALTQWLQVAQITVKVKVGPNIYARLSPDRPDFVWAVPLLIQYLRAKLNL